MSTLYKVYSYLKQMKNREISFQNLINKKIKEVSEQETYLIRDSLKSIVNRYYFLSWEQNRILPLENQDIKDYFICALGTYHYVKNVDIDSLVNSFKQDNVHFNETLPIDEFKKALEGLNGSTLLLSEKENEIMVKRLAISYSYPEWIVKMMIKHFGIKHTYKALAASRKSIKIALNCNTFLTNREKLITSNPSLYEPGVLTKNTLRYIGKDKIIDLDDFKKNFIFVEDEASQLLVDKLDLNPGDETLLVCDDKGTIALDLAMHQKDVGNINVAAPDVIIYNSVRSLANRFKIHSLNVFETNINLLITHVPENSCDKVLLIAPSSSLGLVRRKPATLLALKREELDLLIAEQKRQLDEVSRFVKRDGIILYSVFTYNKKESYLIIEEFLKEHDNFSLVEEKQLFANEGPSDGLYYAILKKD